MFLKVTAAATLFALMGHAVEIEVADVALGGIDTPTVYAQADLPVQFHESPYPLGWDIHFSPYSGGPDVLFTHRCIERLEGLLIRKNPVSYARSIYTTLWRLSEMTCGWMAVNYLAVVAQHEVFGHGYRIRDINRGRAKVDGYSFDVPIPYGPGGAATSYSVSDNLTTTEETSIAMAGVESTAILAFLTKINWLTANYIDPRQTVLYLLSQHDLNLYIGTLKAQGDLSGHDIQGYINSLNQTYTAHFLSGGRLRSLAWINLADPFTYYSMYAWFYYVFTAQETGIPMIPLWNGMKFLPNARLGLTPFGPEYFAEFYLCKDKTPYYFYLKAGNHSDNTYVGLGFFAPSIWTVGKWFFGARFDAWRQPKLLLSPASTPITEIDFDTLPNPDNPLYSYSQQQKILYSAAGSFLVSYQSPGRSGLQTEFGYKACGFLPGYSLRSAPTVRLFYTLLF
ncbi:MAG: hypothetical protein KGJ02_07630 [Verrucomicrobiota bacterium]|nr:hypothetical protein [Verrucomicrobiota bacterium]